MKKLLTSNPDKAIMFNNLNHNDLIGLNKEVGGYDITGGKSSMHSIKFMFKNKPKWHHRFFCKLFLGWKWVDIK